MAESLSSTVTAGIVATLTNPVDDGTASYPLVLPFNASGSLMAATLANGNGADQANQFYAKTQTLVAGANLTLSLHDFGSVVDQLGQVRSITKLKALALQINGSLNNTYVAAVSVQNAGTAYLLNDILTIAGGTGTAAHLQVTAIGGGGSVTTVVVVASAGFTGGSYTANPSTPNTPTGGAGNSLTVNLTMATYTALTAVFIDTDALTFGGTGGTDALTSLFGTNADKFIIQSGTPNMPGMMLLTCGGSQAWAVGASTTNKNIKIANTGSNPVTFTLVVLAAT